MHPQTLAQSRKSLQQVLPSLLMRSIQEGQERTEFSEKGRERIIAGVSSASTVDPEHTYLSFTLP